MSEMENDTKLETAFRQAITDSGKTHYAIHKLSGVATEAILRFIDRKRGLNLSSAGKIADALGYRLVKTDGEATNPVESVKTPGKKATKKAAKKK